jgi:hypothetical protein
MRFLGWSFGRRLRKFGEPLMYGSLANVANAPRPAFPRIQFCDVPAESK